MRFSHELIVPEAGFPFKTFIFEGKEGSYFREKHWHRSIDSPLPNETIVLQIPLKVFENFYTDEEFIWFSHEPEDQDQSFMNLVTELYQVYQGKQLGYELEANSIFYHILYLMVKNYRMTQVDQRSIRKNRNLILT